MLKAIVLISVALIFGLIAFVRLAPVQKDKYDIDPEQAGFANNPGGFFVHPQNGDMESPSFEMDSQTLFERVQNAAETLGGERVSGEFEDFATFVFYSKIMRFPDFMSVKVVRDEQGRARPIIYARLHYGKSDFQVNRRRVLQILEMIQTQ